MLLYRLIYFYYFRVEFLFYIKKNVIFIFLEKINKVSNLFLYIAAISFNSFGFLDEDMGLLAY